MRCLNADCRAAFHNSTELDTSNPHHGLAFDLLKRLFFVRCPYCGARNGLEGESVEDDGRIRLALSRLLD